MSESDDMAQGQDEAAAARLAGALSAETIDALIRDAQDSGTPLDGADGLLNQMTKSVLERALQTEMTEHLGYSSGDPSGHGSGNSRNGTTRKTVATTSGPVDVAVLRDRTSSFEPRIVPKRSRRLGNINDMILSLYARGMTTRDIESHLREVYGVHASRVSRHRPQPRQMRQGDLSHTHRPKESDQGPTTVPTSPTPET